MNLFSYLDIFNTVKVGKGRNFQETKKSTIYWNKDPKFKTYISVD